MSDQNSTTDQAVGIMQASQEQSFGQAATQKLQLDGNSFVAAARAVQ